MVVGLARNFAPEDFSGNIFREILPENFFRRWFGSIGGNGLADAPAGIVPEQCFGRHHPLGAPGSLGGASDGLCPDVIAGRPEWLPGLKRIRRISNASKIVHFERSLNGTIFPLMDTPWPQVGWML